MNEGEKVSFGEVWVKDSVIEKVIISESDDMLMDHDITYDTSDTFDEQIDCMGNLLMPGFKNCHAHGPMTFLRSFADDLPLQRWLNEKIFPAEAKLQKEDIYTLMQLAVLEYISSGITTSFEMYFYPEMIAEACKDLGFRVVISGTVFGFDETMDEAINTLRNDYNTFHKYDDLVDYRLGFHSEYSCSKNLIKGIADLSKELKAPVYMHNSETQKEVAECIKRHGMTPVQLMDSLGLFEYGGAGHHLVYTDDKDREILKNKNIYVVTNPSSNLKLASGIAPIKEYIDQGINVAIGTDVKYAIYVELGHNQQPGRYVPAIGKRLVASHVAAKPFLKPALEGHKDEYVRIVKGEYGIE